MDGVIFVGDQHRTVFYISPVFTPSLTEGDESVLTQWTGEKTLAAKHCFLHLMKMP